MAESVIEGVSNPYGLHLHNPSSAKRKSNRTRQKKLLYAADFEATTTPDDCRVWSWGLCAIPDDWEALELDDVEVGTTLDDFIENLSTQNTACYFHNLKYDASFILDWLLNHGYEYQAEGKALPGTFKTLISDMGQFYTVTVHWENGYVTEFRDSLKKFPNMSVADVAVTFNMPLQKGDIDYELARPVGYVPTAAEWEYQRRDVWIIARALGQQFASGLERLTAGSDALFEFKRLLGRANFDRLFPILSTDLDAEIRRAYRGGFTYADPRFTGRLQGCGSVFDVNSLYPSVMFYQPIPYGEPEWVDGYVEGTDLRPLTIFGITFTAKLKPNHIPCIQIKGSFQFAETEYLREVKEPTTLMVTNVDFELMKDHYDLNVLEYNGGWRFSAANGIFDEYINKWSAIKANSVGGRRFLAKGQLNNLYGKFATNPNVTGKYPVLDENGTVQLRIGAEETRNPVYTAAGVFITSYARDITIRAAQANYDTFAYADTDSLHLLSNRPPTGLSVHPTELGAWKHEYDFDAAYYVRPKAYLEREAGVGYHNAIAGVPKHMSAKLKFRDLQPGVELTIGRQAPGTSYTVLERKTGGTSPNVLMHGKLTPRRVPGGVVLQNIPFELKL